MADKSFGLKQINMIGVGTPTVESSTDLVINTNGSERIRVDSSGDVGIGTTNPGYKVHVEGTGEVFINVVGDVAPAGGGANLRLQNKNTTANSLSQIQSADAGGQTTSAISFYNVDNTTNEGYMMFLTRPSGGSPTEAARFTSAGNLRFPSGQGIDFSATSDAGGMSSELLDDYEEGTFTPTWGNGGTAYSSPAPTYSVQYGDYTKVGNVVYYDIHLITTAWNGAAATMWVHGLPFTSRSIRYQQGGGGIFCIQGVDGANAISNLTTQIGNGKTNLELYYQTAASGNNYNTFDTGSVNEAGTVSIRINGFYFTNS